MNPVDAARDLRDQAIGKNDSRGRIDRFLDVFVPGVPVTKVITKLDRFGNTPGKPRQTFERTR